MSGLPGWKTRPYYATHHLDWFRDPRDPAGPGAGSLVVNTQGKLCTVVRVIAGQPKYYPDRGWLTTEGWVTQYVRYPTPEELARYQLASLGAEDAL